MADVGGIAFLNVCQHSFYPPAADVPTFYKMVSSVELRFNDGGKAVLWYWKAQIANWSFIVCECWRSLKNSRESKKSIVLRIDEEVYKALENGQRWIPKCEWSIEWLIISRWKKTGARKKVLSEIWEKVKAREWQGLLSFMFYQNAFSHRFLHRIHTGRLTSCRCSYFYKGTLKEPEFSPGLFAFIHVATSRIGSSLIAVTSLFFMNSL